MAETAPITKLDLKKIALKIKEDFFKPVNTYKTTVFVCGGDINKSDTTRAKVALFLSDLVGKVYYDLIYPEAIFDELLYSYQGKDLLSLENMLANSVDVILIIPESPGSLAELGAFANTKELLNKIICLVDFKYRKQRSFIVKGPIKLIRQANKHAVIYIDPLNIRKDMQKIKNSIKRIKNNSSKDKEKIGLLQLDNFLLPIIYLLEPVPKEMLIECVAASDENETNYIQATTVALTTLIKNKLIELTANGYKLTTLGVKNFLDLRKTRNKIKSQAETLALDNMRLEILNLKYRKKKLKI